MKERPILFNGAMVRAILDGRKTQTRRIVKPQPSGDEKIHEWDQGNFYRAPMADPRWADFQFFGCPYGQPGDYLWVRETHAIVPTTAYRASEGVDQTINPCEPSDAAIYREGWTRSAPGVRWRPSIHMSRWASRILLEVISVRVEQVQDISMYDAMDEGVETTPALFEKGSHLVGAFAALWDSINEKRGYSWAVNPWVWVVEFKQVQL